MEAQRKHRWREGRLKEVDAPWKPSCVDDVPEEPRSGVRQGVCPAWDLLQQRESLRSFWGLLLSMLGGSMSGTKAGALRVKSKGVILMGGFVRIG